jgi:type VI secretion system protein ImpF
MAELLNQERLQPSLLDRLMDDEPEQKQESRERRVLSLRKLRQGVLRDLSWLMNATNQNGRLDSERFPEVARSVVNYGMPDLAGFTAASLDIPTLERMVKEVILRFEPRILAHTLKVRAIADLQQMSHNTIGFNIEGELWAQPVPLRLFLKTDIDLEAGFINVVDYLGGSD